jgi:hypothetical protein
MTLGTEAELSQAIRDKLAAVGREKGRGWTAMEADVDGDGHPAGMPARIAAVGHDECSGRVTHHAHKRAAL